MKSNSLKCDANVYCKKCALCIYTELRMYVECGGPCGHSYHIGCVGLNRELLRSLSYGFVWLCTECHPALNDWKNAKQATSPPPVALNNSVNTELAQLKLQVSAIMGTLDRIIPEDISTVSTSAIQLHSTPIAAPAEVMSGTNMSYESENSRAVPSAVLENDASFALLLTNIHIATTENDVDSLVRRCLGVPAGDCISVIKLVPKQVDYRLLNYISFKIVLNRRCKDLAMCASTWPHGIKFREFVNRFADTWKP